MKKQDMFKKLFKVIVPRIATYSEAEIETFGVRIDGYFDKEGFVNSDTNKVNLTMDTRVMLPLNKIIDIYASGYPIKVINNEDVVKIGQMLDDYITQNFEDYSIHTRSGKDDRMDIIEEFMKEILNRHIKKFEKKANIQANAFGIEGLDLMNTDSGIMNTHRPNIQLVYDENDTESYRPTYSLKD